MNIVNNYPLPFPHIPVVVPDGPKRAVAIQLPVRARVLGVYRNSTNSASLIYIGNDSQDEETRAFEVHAVRFGEPANYSKESYLGTISGNDTYHFRCRLEVRWAVPLSGVVSLSEDSAYRRWQRGEIK